MKKFVCINDDYVMDDVHIKAREIGIVSSENEETATIDFVTQKTPITLNKNLITVFDPTETGDAYEYKVCNRCGRLLPTVKFSINQNGKNNRPVRRPSCTECRSIIDGKRVSSKDKKIWLTKKPDFEIWECPICGKRTIPGLTSKVVLDHNHITGKPRAWICDSCNTGLGRFKDDITTIKKAVQYLKKEK